MSHEPKEHTLNLTNANRLSKGTSKGHYLTNEFFLAALVESHTLDQPTDDLGLCFMTLARKTVMGPQFVHHPMRDDLVSAAVETCLRYWRSFDMTQKNPFSYFTRTCMNAYLKVIQREQRHQALHHDLVILYGIDDNRPVRFEEP